MKKKIADRTRASRSCRSSTNPMGSGIIFVFISAILFLSLVPNVYADQVLSKIETYKAPPFPADEYNERRPGMFDIEKELYDSQVEEGRRVPPTLTDTLILDLWKLMTMSLKLKLRGITPYTISEEDVKQALNYYLSIEWLDSYGLRWWTHWNFVHALSEAERNILAKEVVERTRENGVTLIDYEAYDRDRGEYVKIPGDAEEGGGEYIYVYYGPERHETIESISPEIITTTEGDTGETHTYYIEVSPT